MRIAFFSPLNPKRSGISDYSEELLPYLAKGATIDLVTDHYLPSNEELRRNHRVLHPEEFLGEADRYDRVIYQIGNSLEYHGYMVPCLAKVPGIVVLHDYSLGYLVLGMTMARGDAQTIDRVLQQTMDSKQARVIRNQLLRGQLDSYRLSLARPIVEMALGVIVHNRYAFDRFRQEYPGIPARMIWHATPERIELGKRDQLRERYGISRDAFLIASVSRLAFNKRIDLVLRCLARLVEKHPSVQLVLVGEGTLGEEARKTIERKGLKKHVILTGWVDSQAYLDYIDMADAAIDLRHPTAGETSGGSLRLLQAGKPIVATAQGFFLELPTNCVLLVEPGAAQEEEQVVASLEKLVTDVALRQEMARASRQFALRHLQIEDAAKAYLEFVGEIDKAAKPAGKWELPVQTVSRWIQLIYNCGRTVQYVQKYGISGVAEKLKRSF